MTYASEKSLSLRLRQFAHYSLYWQLLMLVALAALLVIPLFFQAPKYIWQTPWNNAQLFSEWVLWALWYPGTLLSVLLVGRLWCGVLCPLGAMSEWASHIGMRVRLPQWVKHPATTALSFVWVTIWAQTLDVRDDLHSAAILFAIIFVLAIGCGLLFGSHNSQGRRVWCRHLCPIGSVLGVFSRLGKLNVMAKQPHGDTEGYRIDGLCPTGIELRTKQSSRHCIKCMRCVTPQKRGGMAIEVRPIGDEIQHIEQHAPCFSELWFIWLAPGLAVAGFVWSSSPIYVSLRQWLGHFALSHQWYTWLQPGPNWLMEQSSALNQHYLWLDMISIGIFMLLCALILAGLLALGAMAGARLLGHRHLLMSQRISEFGYQFAPMAMLCILLGLGSTLFASLKSELGGGERPLLLVLVGAALAFNLLHGQRWLRQQNLSPLRAIAAFSVLLSGCLCLVLATGWSIFPALSI
ncbi:4Fe-4S binding protein [Celerinatantimonas yamalensis]|uniref:4Fe-4S binding protein n=1 Tax=Celerinatantimonas yamalensis TaxID=559956 RepID=A0ABW9G558_9GAMM